MLQAVLILRLFDITHMYQDMEFRLRIREKFSGESDLLKLVCFVIFVTHYQACIWNILADYELKNDYD